MTDSRALSRVDVGGLRAALRAACPCSDCGPMCPGRL